MVSIWPTRTQADSTCDRWTGERPTPYLYRKVLNYSRRVGSRIAPTSSLPGLIIRRVHLVLSERAHPAYGTSRSWAERRESLRMKAPPRGSHQMDRKSRFWRACGITNRSG